MAPIVSVVIPLYNKEAYIKNTLNLVLAQKIKDFEIIVVNDGSTDKSAEVVKSFSDPRIRLINQVNAGVSVARNRGINEAKADLIAFLDGDDEWKTNFLEEILELKNKYPEAGVYATAYEKSKRGEINIANIRGFPPAPWKGLLPSYFLSTALGDSPICSSSVCVPKCTLLEVGMFKVGVKWGEDDDLWGRIALKYPIAFSWEIGAIYNQGATNRACSSQYPIKEHPFVERIRIMNDKQELTDFPYLRECIAKFQILAAKQDISNGYNSLARKNLKYCKTKLLYREKIFWYSISMLPNGTFNPTLNILSKTKVLSIIKLFAQAIKFKF